MNSKLFRIGISFISPDLLKLIPVLRYPAIAHSLPANSFA